MNEENHAHHLFPIALGVEWNLMMETINLDKGQKAFLLMMNVLNVGAESSQLLKSVHGVRRS